MSGCDIDTMLINMHETLRSLLNVTATHHSAIDQGEGRTVKAIVFH